MIMENDDKANDVKKGHDKLRYDKYADIALLFVLGGAVVSSVGIGIMMVAQTLGIVLFIAGWVLMFVAIFLMVWAIRGYYKNLDN